MDFSSNNRAILGSNAAIRRIFVLHLVNLYEYGLLTPHQIDDCLKLLMSQLTPRDLLNKGQQQCYDE